jgi:hypothetical protein
LDLGLAAGGYWHWRYHAGIGRQVRRGSHQPTQAREPKTRISSSSNPPHLAFARMIAANLAVLIRNDLPIPDPKGSANHCTHLRKDFPLGPNTVNLKILDSDASTGFPP